MVSVWVVSPSQWPDSVGLEQPRVPRFALVERGSNYSGDPIGGISWLKAVPYHSAADANVATIVPMPRNARADKWRHSFPDKAPASWLFGRSNTMLDSESNEACEVIKVEFFHHPRAVSLNRLR